MAAGQEVPISEQGEVVKGPGQKAGGGVLYSYDTEYQRTAKLKKYLKITSMAGWNSTYLQVPALGKIVRVPLKL